MSKHHGPSLLLIIFAVLSVSGGYASSIQDRIKLPPGLRDGRALRVAVKV